MALRALVVGAPHDTVATEQPLSGTGWRVARMDDPTTAVSWLRTAAVDVVVLDTEAGDLSLVRRVRRATAAPMLALLEGQDDDRLVAALEAGADAALPASSGGALVSAQAAALARRQRRRSGTREAVEVGPLRLDPSTREVHVHGHPIRLTRIEFDLLSLLMTDPCRVLGRAQILAAVWGEWFGPDHLVEVHLSRMRSKIVRAGGPRIGHAVPGVGYRLLTGDADSPADPDPVSGSGTVSVTGPGSGSAS